MKIINAPNEYHINLEQGIYCFLAGGMGHTEWQDKCLKELAKYELDLTVLNPFNSDIKDIKEQIKWEYRYLNSYPWRMIFSIYFDKYTNQPISMYELGRATVLCRPIKIDIGRYAGFDTYTIQNGFPVIVSVHKEAKHKDEILYQCELADIPCEIRTPEEHAIKIKEEYEKLKEKLYGNN